MIDEYKMSGIGKLSDNKCLLTRAFNDTWFKCTTEYYLAGMCRFSKFSSRDS